MATTARQGTRTGTRIVSPQESEAARLQLLVKEKALTRSRDALGRRPAADAVDGGREGV